MVHIVIFCHVEPGTVRNRKIVFDAKREEGIVSALPRIVDFADEEAVPLTFAMTPTALRRNNLDLDGHEVGIHLHPQDALLQATLGKELNLPTDCLARYSEEDQRALVAVSRRVFEDTQGREPHTFVAGNWSESTTTLQILIEAGFRYDGSPLPGHQSECADWSRIARLAQPFTPSTEDYQGPGQADLLYLPVYQGLWNHYLTPENIHLLGTAYFKAALKEAVVGGADLVHMFFHSPMALDPFFLAAFTEVLAYARDMIHARLVLPTTLQASERPRSSPFPPAYFAYLDWPMVKGIVGRGELGRRLLGEPPPPS